MKKFVLFCKDESGATAIEYGLIAGLVAVGGVFGLQAAGESLSTFMTETSVTLDNAL